MPSGRRPRRTSSARSIDGWTLVPTQYSDGGYTGANIERPGVRQLLADIEAGKVDLFAGHGTGCGRSDGRKRTGNAERDGCRV